MKSTRDGRKVIKISASSFNQARTSPGIGRVANDAWGRGVIAYVNNNPPIGMFATWTFDVPDNAGGNYDLWMSYAHLGDRPVQIVVNERVEVKQALVETTGSLVVTGQLYKSNFNPIGLHGGKNYLLVKSQKIFPHLGDFEFRPT